MKSFWTFIFLIFSLSIFSQEKKSGLEYVPNEFIIQLEEGTDANLFFNKVKKQLGESGIIFHNPHHFSKVLNLYLLKTKTEIEDVNMLLQSLYNYPEIIIAGQNFKAQQRAKTPDDPMYTSQWGMEVIKAPEVWEITTGGVTALGDTIVVAMIESGDWRHDDLVDNVWINRNEINNDGIDNDGNGYIDDFYGWNVVDSSDIIGVDVQGHGALVGGIIGATGDNGIGVSGVNWNVKIMWVQNNLFVDKIIESYEYVYQTRKLWNETNGEKGAFVVASNGSFGIEGDSPTFPNGLSVEANPLFGLWCEMHQKLGEEGILGIGSTANKEFNVDDIGDIPSICPSDYLIAVGESNQQDNISSGFGKLNVDLTAPGRGTPSTTANNGYSTIDGTSAATPHVAGGIALLYSVPCDKLAQAAREEPSLTALSMKNFILNGVDKLSDHTEKTVSGGRLNLEKSMNQIQDFCGSGLDILSIDMLFPNPINKNNDILNVSFTPNQYGPYQIEVFNSIGQRVGEFEFIAEDFLPSFFQIKNLREYKSGVYFLRISNNLDFITTKFVIN